MKILVLGGTNFFGKKAVRQLIDHGHNVTIATRGNTPNPFKGEAIHKILDVQDATHPGWKEITNQSWDAVFDNICYTAEDAQLRIDKFADITEYYYVTSSMAVYQGDQSGYLETDFDPLNYRIDSDVEVTYGEGKRQVEQVLFNDAPFHVTTFRFPIVLDRDDYTERLYFYVEQVLKDQPIYFTDSEIKVNYVKGTTAADSIVWAIEHQKTGIYNVSSADAITVRQFISWLSHATDAFVHVIYERNPDVHSPFQTQHDQYLISDKIQSEGFELKQLEDWLPDLMQYFAQKIKNDHHEM